MIQVILFRENNGVKGLTQLNEFLSLQKEDDLISVTVIQHKTALVYTVVYRVK